MYVGDGHAAQDDGELNGNALETSMDVEFAVDVIPAKGIQLYIASDYRQLAFCATNPARFGTR